MIDETGNKYGKLKYDFAIFDDDGNLIRLIEFDGPQHYETENCWYSEEGKIRDIMKNQYALSNGFPLIRIPYKEKGKYYCRYVILRRILVCDMM